MKTIFKSIAVASVLAVLASCSAENPFGQEDSEGVLRLHFAIDPQTVTRSGADDDLSKYTQQYLRENAEIVLCNDKGVLYHWNKSNPMPASVTLKYGSYTFETWSGDSVPASFNNKYFRATTSGVVVNSPNQQIALQCPIANRVVSINEATYNSAYVKSLSVKVYNAKGSVVFKRDAESSNMHQKAYFMMSSLDKANANTLYYEVSGVNSVGKAISVKGTIPNTQSAHEYRLNFKMDPGQSNQTPTSGTHVSIAVEEGPVGYFNEQFGINSAPQFTWVGGRDLDSQVVAAAGQFQVDETLRVACFGSFTQLRLQTDAENIPGFTHYKSVDWFNTDQSLKDELEQNGIKVEQVPTVDGQEKYFIYFKRDWLNSLPASDTPIVVNVSATDNQGHTSRASLSVATSESAVTSKNPVEPAGSDELAADLTAVKATSVDIPVTVNDASVEGLCLQYREQGASDWQQTSISFTRATRGTASLTGLKPGTTYEYRTAWGGAKPGFSATSTLTTEAKFIIPNASMEDWSDFSEKSNVLLPAAGGVRTFWDTGNHGSATMSVNITQKGTEMAHTGSACAKLQSQFVGLGSIGKFAAGNIFAGTYLKTDGTDGVLEFGRPYNGSHPSALSVWVNYRPGKGVNKKGANASYIKEGETDKAQIYVALTTQAVEIRTKSSNQKLFDPEGSEVLAYGQQTFDSNFGPDGSLQNVVIPLDYKPAAKTTKATHLVIVVSASKFGDFFSGGEGSLMYVDDFELVY